MRSSESDYTYKGVGLVRFTLHEEDLSRGNIASGSGAVVGCRAGRFSLVQTVLVDNGRQSEGRCSSVLASKGCWAEVDCSRLL